MQDAILNLLTAILPYIGYAVLIIAVGFFLLMARSVTRDARRRSARHKNIQDRYIRR